MAKKVLIVEDAKTDAELIGGLVRAYGAHVVEASDGKQALDMVKSEKPDLIFMDVNMVNMDGFEATRQILAIPEFKDVPIVFVTSKGQKADQVWAKMLGGKGFVAKPYSNDKIVGELKKFLG